MNSIPTIQREKQPSLILNGSWKSLFMFKKEEE